MNWKEIKEKHPKAFALLIKWLACTVEVKIEDDELVTYLPVTPVHRITKRETMPLRRLYDFFDEQEIYIDVNYNRENRLRFAYAIHLPEQGKIINSPDEVPERTEMETAAFTKSFELLEFKP